jgi:hypothetical protein
MPAHSPQLLQPLDVGCFNIIKKAYGQLVQQKLRLGVNHIDKHGFLNNYPAVRIVAYKITNIESAFAGAGLVPLDAHRVLDKLDIKLRTHTPGPAAIATTVSIRTHPIVRKI